MKKDLKSLKNFCKEHEQHLIDGVNILLEGERSHFRTYENALKGHVCGRSSRVLGYLLETNGFDVKGYMTQYLGWDYVDGGHIFLVVDLDEEVIVDSAYYQFIDIFDLKEDQMPQEDIMIVPYVELDEKIDEFVELRNLRLRTHPNPEVLTHQKLECSSRRYNQSDQELHDYFKRIWDYRSDIYHEVPPSSLKNDIKRIREGDDSITDLTRKVVNYLAKENLIKED
ncbi:MAG: hypothetical protein J7L08_01125 [Candidatus Aenigmarchaeota archaeon]|nr:hypothetical protein [Candidatus Aenigmarchaeota archaeon]